jgi:hypothetical protein
VQFGSAGLPARAATFVGDAGGGGSATCLPLRVWQRIGLPFAAMALASAVCFVALPLTAPLGRWGLLLPLVVWAVISFVLCAPLAVMLQRHDPTHRSVRARVLAPAGPLLMGCSLVAGGAWGAVLATSLQQAVSLAPPDRPGLALGLTSSVFAGMAALRLWGVAEGFWAGVDPARIDVAVCVLALIGAPLLLVTSLVARE